MIISVPLHSILFDLSLIQITNLNFKLINNAFDKKDMKLSSIFRKYPERFLSWGGGREREERQSIESI